MVFKRITSIFLLGAIIAPMLGMEKENLGLVSTQKSSQETLANLQHALKGIYGSAEVVKDIEKAVEAVERQKLVEADQRLVNGSNAQLERLNNGFPALSRADQQERASRFFPILALVSTATIVAIKTVQEYQRIDTKAVAWYKRPLVALGKGIVEAVKLPWYALQRIDSAFMQFVETMN